MKVICYINVGGKKYEWNKLSPKQQQEYRAKMNENAMRSLGYVRKK